MLLKNNSNSNSKSEENNNNAKEEISGTTKTLMIYMCGSDLESENCLGTINLSHLMESDIDYNNINIVLCAGGTQRWYNSEISEKETSIYNINEKGITKEKKQSKQDMADGNTITNFIDYVYENYETDEYYFMFWNHGMALDGLEFDELSGNILSLAELDNCLANTKLNEDNNDGTYTSVFKSSDTNIDGNGLITANINNKMISVTDNSDGNEFVLGNLIELDKTNEYIMYGLPVVLEGYDEENNLSMTAALMKLKLNKDGTIEMLEIHDWVKSEDGKVSTNGAIIDLKSTDKYQTIYFLKSTRTVEIDENGNYVKLGDLKASYGITMSSNANFIFKNVDLEQGKKYVGVFCVKDVYNEEYYSKLINIE